MPSLSIPYGGDALYRAVDLGQVFIKEHPKDPTAIAIRQLADEVVERHRAGRLLTGAV
jgi:Flp pilus assembly CpaE family ATPase